MNQYISSLYENILSAVSRLFLDNADIFDIPTIEKHLFSEKFKDKIDAMLIKKDFQCSSVYYLCHDIIKEISSEELNEEWLWQPYIYIVNQAFPDTKIDSIVSINAASCKIYICILKEFLRYQKFNADDSLQSKYPILPLSKEEINSFDKQNEYFKFVKAFSDENIYELYKLDQEINGFNTLDSICCTSFLATTIARSLKNAGQPVNIGKIFGASFGYTIGKFACSDFLCSTTPYSNYYYTDQWYSKHDMPYTGHVAVNHSIWDLELENLPLESLILVYSDFRTKETYDKNGVLYTEIFDLNTAFQLMLVDPEILEGSKKERYERVFNKLKDFEEYIHSLGISTDLSKLNVPVEFQNSKKHYSLMHGQEIVKNLKLLAINHNINVMHQLKDETSLNNILELARNEDEWIKLRKYLHNLEEYSTYLTSKQKLIIIKFLYDQLVHSKENIRRICAQMIGTFIVKFDEDYRKHIPTNEAESFSITSTQLFDKYLNQFILPDHKIIDLHKTWIGFSISIMIGSVFSHCPEYLLDDYFSILLKYFKNDFVKNNETKLYLLESIKHIPFNIRRSYDFLLYDFIFSMLEEEDSTLRLSALDLIANMLRAVKNGKYHLEESFLDYVKSIVLEKIYINDSVAENYLYLTIAEMLSIDKDLLEKYQLLMNRDTDRIPDIYLSNLKNATDWIMKSVQIDLLLDYALRDTESSGFYTAMHFCNILKVSVIENVRARAGEALIKIIPLLPLEQRNDVAIELLRALEINGFQHAESISNYLGYIMLFLQPYELDELLDDIVERVKQASPQLSLLLLKTISISIENYEKYLDYFKEDNLIYSNRLSKMLGIILKGMVDYNSTIREFAFSVLGKIVFGSNLISRQQKHNIFQTTAKKILTLLNDTKIEGTQLKENFTFANSVYLNNIYRFITDYTYFFKEINLPVPTKVAFFPGSFDPFSKGHNQIVTAIQELGFEVYLAIDEFSWSKRTLPNQIRRNIINMSIANELNIYLFPEEFQINIANPVDLGFLRSLYKGAEVYIVVGSDVVFNASAYLKEKVENSIQTFAHIVFHRKGAVLAELEKSKIQNYINAPILELSLPAKYEDISSTQIRNYIDENKEISMLVDSLAQKYIYENGFYQREPQYKTQIAAVSFDIQVVDIYNKKLIDELAEMVGDRAQEMVGLLIEFWTRHSRRILIIRDSNIGNKIIGFSMFHRIHSSRMYHDLKNSYLTDYIRNNAVGKTALISGIFVNPLYSYENLEQILLTESMAFCLTKDYDYSIYNCLLSNYMTDSMDETLSLQGFIKLDCEIHQNPVYAVDMSYPATLNLDIETVIKEPYKSGPIFQSVLKSSRKKLQKAICSLNPGTLLLPFDRRVMYEALIKKVCIENKVPTTPLTPRVLGEAMCVPYGSILNSSIVPNTVTKSLHTEKMFEPDMRSYNIAPFPYYTDLDIQLKMLRSFNRPVILIDDILDQGYRLKVIEPLLKNKNIKIQKIIVGLLSGRGKELAEIQGRDIDCIYFIPRLREWYNENSCYPFIGGNAIWRGSYPKRNLLPSINLILPYTSPNFIKNSSKRAILHMSDVIMHNALDILKAIEAEYQSINERSLTLNQMGQVFNTPRCPDHGINMDYDLNLSPSHYLKNDMELLVRLSKIID